MPEFYKIATLLLGYDNGIKKMHTSNGEGELLKIQKLGPARKCIDYGGNTQIFLKSGGSVIAFHGDEGR